MQSKTFRKADKFYNDVYRRYLKCGSTQTPSMDEIFGDLKRELEESQKEVHNLKLQRTTLTLEL